MSVLASAYMAGYLAFGVVVAWREKAEEGRLKADTIMEIPMDACLICTAAAYWHEPLASALKPLLAPLFVAGAATLALLLLNSARETACDPDLSLGERLFVGVLGVFVSVLFASPLLYWGFQVAFSGVGA